MVSFSGTSSRRVSSVTVPMTTMVFSVGAIFSPVPREASMASRLRESGGRLVRDMKRRRRTTLLKFESVLPTLAVSEEVHERLACEAQKWNV